MQILMTPGSVLKASESPQDRETAGSTRNASTPTKY